MRNVPLHLDYKGKHLVGIADPIDDKKESGVPLVHTIYLQGKYLGTLTYQNKGWVMDRPVDLNLIEYLGEYLMEWYE